VASDYPIDATARICDAPAAMSPIAMAMASARVETFSFRFAFSKCSCAVEGEIPSLPATSRSVAPRAISRSASISRLVSPSGGAANPCFETRLRSRS
jgi:hypothetical protein